MKFCGLYNNSIDMKIFDEIAINYEGQSSALIPFISKYIDKRIILVISNIHDFYAHKEWEIINTIAQQYSEARLSICFYNLREWAPFDAELQECINNLTLPFFTGHAIVNFDQLNYALNHGVSDVYLCEDICFDLVRAKRLCSLFEVNIRTFPNITQCSVKETPAVKQFFIRPEDLMDYDDVIDTIEFWGPENRQEVLYRIYQRGSWFGDLNDIILGEELNIDSRRVVPHAFGNTRKMCGRRCMKGEVCTLCNKIVDLSKTLEQQNILFLKTDKLN